MAEALGIFLGREAARRIAREGWSANLFDLLLGAWNQAVGPGAPADLTGDGFVGAGDLDVLLGAWNLGVPAAAAVPEPASALLLAGLGGALLARRR